MRKLPKVDECINLLYEKCGVQAPHFIVKKVVQNIVEQEREKILESEQGYTPPSEHQWQSLFLDGIEKKMRPNLQRVFNATGVVIHTNLGRSVLSEETARCLSRAGGYYSNLEFDLATGKRGSRYSLVEGIICDLTGAEAALVVNNNAAAVLIALDTLAKGREVIVSRGQLVEIGGSFRIPDVMAKSGACLREVGATNRTHLRDYENAICDQTAMLLRVHTSNFRIIGFTSEVTAEEMVALARKNNLVTMEDLGSGSLIDFSRYGFPREPTVQQIVKAGVDVVTFSGDKLLGGPQAGIIVGSARIIDAIKKNPLNRALRIDKFTLAALESVLKQYYEAEEAVKKIPTLYMLTTSREQIASQAHWLLKMIRDKIGARCEAGVVETVSRVGGGALPEHSIPSWAVELRPLDMAVNKLEQQFRELKIPIIGRIENDVMLLDLRTIQPHEVSELGYALVEFFTMEEVG